MILKNYQSVKMPKKKKDLTIAERAQIVSLHTQGVAQCDIAKNVHDVYYKLQCFNETGSYDNDPKLVENEEPVWDRTVRWCGFHYKNRKKGV